MSADVRNVHEPRHLRWGQYYACSEPERPHETDATQYDLRCHRCRIAARATVAIAGDVLMPFYDCQTGEDRPRWLSEALATSESRYAMPAVAAGEQAPREGA